MKTETRRQAKGNSECKQSYSRNMIQLKTEKDMGSRWDPEMMREGR